MNNWDVWAMQKKELARQSDPGVFIAAITTELATYGDQSKVEALLSLASTLRADLIVQGWIASSELRSRQIVEVLRLAEGILPRDPLPAMMTASHLHFDCCDALAAYPHAVRAVAKARSQRDALRQCVGDLIRICIVIGRFEEVESLLDLLAEYEPDESAMEIQLESDFLQNIPTGTISETTLQAYMRRLRQS